YVIDTSNCEIYTLSLHDALPICFKRAIEEKNVVISEFSEMVANMGIQRIEVESISDNNINLKVEGLKNTFVNLQEYNFNEKKYRSEEHTSELQSRENLVCRLLLE